jgi:hypothetical protein
VQNHVKLDPQNKNTLDNTTEALLFIGQNPSRENHIFLAIFNSYIPLISTDKN